MFCFVIPKMNNYNQWQFIYSNLTLTSLETIQQKKKRFIFLEFLKHRNLKGDTFLMIIFLQIRTLFFLRYWRDFLYNIYIYIYNCSIDNNNENDDKDCLFWKAKLYILFLLSSLELCIKKEETKKLLQIQKSSFRCCCCG